MIPYLTNIILVMSRVKPFYCGAGSAEFPQQGHCASELTSVEVRTATLTDFDSSTQDIETATIQTPGVLNAYGVVFLTVVRQFSNLP